MSDMDVVIVGAGGHGKVVLDILQAEGKYRPVGFLDADPSLSGMTVSGLPVLGAVNQIPRLRQQKLRHAIVAIGDNRTRSTYAKLLQEQGLELISAVHPTASVSRSVKLGCNVVIAAGAVVTAEATLGDSVILNTGGIVDHECVVGDAVHVCPAAVLAGRVRVGPGAFIGLGARVIQCLTIGEHAVIGAGAVVLRDIPAHVTAVGVPARVLERP